MDSKYSKNTEYPIYSPSTEDQEKIGHIVTRFSAMKQSRSVVEKNWGIYQKMIDAVLVPYSDWRSSSNVPLSSALIELFVAETLKLKTQFDFKAETSEYKHQARALEHVWDYDWRKWNRNKVFNENEYIVAAFGTSIIYTGFESYTKKQKDLTISDDLDITYKENEIRKDSIVVWNVDIRDLWIDDQAISDIEQANDCIYRQWISFERRREISNSKAYKNRDSVAPKWYSTDDHRFTTDEERSKTWEYVELLHYWNLANDDYMVLANGVLVREHPVMSTMWGEKALPFTIRVLGKKNYSIYGRGFCEALMMFNSEINNLREMIMDAVKRSNNQTLAIGNWLTFNWSSFSYDNEILEFDGTFANNFEQISGNPPNQAIFNYMESLYKDIAIYIGIDIQNIIWQASQTAFQTEVQREASQKRVNVWLYNRDLAYERFANLYKDLLQTFFPIKTAKWLYPEIEIEWEEYKNGKFKKKKGNSVFQVTPEALRGDMYIDVFTNINAPTINAVDKQMQLDFIMTMQNSWFDLSTIMDVPDEMKELAKKYNFKVESGSNDEVQEWIKETNEQLKALMPKNLPTNPEEWQPMWWSQPMNSNTETWAVM